MNEHCVWYRTERNIQKIGSVVGSVPITRKWEAAFMRAGIRWTRQPDKHTAIAVTRYTYMYLPNHMLRTPVSIHCTLNASLKMNWRRGCMAQCKRVSLKTRCNGRSCVIPYSLVDRYKDFDGGDLQPPSSERVAVSLSGIPDLALYKSSGTSHVVDWYKDSLRRVAGPSKRREKFTSRHSSTSQGTLRFFEPCIVICLCNKNEQNAHFLHYCIKYDSHRASSLICGNKMPTRCNRRYLLQILLLAQHVSGTIMPIIRSSRVLYRWSLPVVFVALVFKLSVWCGAEGYVSGLRAAATTRHSPNVVNKETFHIASVRFMVTMQYLLLHTREFRARFLSTTTFQFHSHLGRTACRLPWKQRSVRHQQ